MPPMENRKSGRNRALRMIVDTTISQFGSKKERTAYLQGVKDAHKAMTITIHSLIQHVGEVTMERKIA